MGTSIKDRKDTNTSKYCIKEDVDPIQSSSFIVNEDGSVTKRSPKKVVRKDNPKSIKTIEKHTKGNPGSIVLVGTVLYIIATVIFFVLLVVNTYEDGETIVDWIEILIGLSFISGIIYALIIRPILNWLNDLI